MDPDSLTNSTSKAPRKVRFAPKAPPKREQKLILPKAEKTETDLDEAKQELLLRFNETSLKPKYERKVAPAEVAFGIGGSSKPLRSYGASKGINKNQGSSSNGGAGQRLEKEYKEPWDYHHSYYPTTLPLRGIYSGNPDLLDKEEFDEDPYRSAYDENDTNTAEELLDENPENNKFLLQLPTKLPAIRQPGDSEVQESENKANPAKGSETSKKPIDFESLPEGFIGKLMVYRSGAVKLKIHDMLYDVSAGLDCTLAQDVVAINTERKHCCNLGELNKRFVVTPDVDTMLEANDDL